MKKILNTLIWLLVISGFIYVGYKGITWGVRSAGDNQFEYDLKALKDVPKEMISHKQTQTIPINTPKLTAVAVAYNNDILVGADKELIIFSADGAQKQSTELTNKIEAITIDKTGTIYIAGRSTVTVLDKSLQERASWRSGTGRSIFTSIAVNDQYIYVADAGNKVVLILDKQGQKVMEAGQKNIKKNSPGLIVPSPFCDVAIDETQSLWVVNPGRHALEKYSNTGDMIKSWSKTTNQLEGFSGCCNPTHIAMMPNGNIVTSEKGLVRIKLYSVSGELKSVVAAPSDFTDETKGLDLAVDSNNRIIVADPHQNAIRIFETL